MTAAVALKSRHTNLSELPENAKLLAKVKAWDFSAEMRRFQKEYPHEDVQKAVEDFRHFIYLCVADKAQYFIPSFEADHFWHICLWFTHNWMAFSQDISGDFIHHNPLEEALLPEDARIKLDEIRAASIRHFGKEVLKISDVVCCM
ncbi:MAG: hypothetical protein RH949_02525 [Coleofasciculus sp. A1-SPW-01]|uniref:hypothetical protein n=1 Tax=Coleofasciculus sp. A1-SPW-01 TaxID=3070819 RepID=UPI0032F524CD